MGPTMINTPRYIACHYTTHTASPDPTLPLFQTADSLYSTSISLLFFFVTQLYSVKTYHLIVLYLTPFSLRSTFVSTTNIFSEGFQE